MPDSKTEKQVKELKRQGAKQDEIDDVLFINEVVKNYNNGEKAEALKLIFDNIIVESLRFEEDNVYTLNCILSKSDYADGHGVSVIANSKIDFGNYDVYTIMTDKQYSNMAIVEFEDYLYIKNV